MPEKMKVKCSTKPRRCDFEEYRSPRCQILTYWSA